MEKSTSLVFEPLVEPEKGRKMTEGIFQDPGHVRWKIMK